MNYINTIPSSNLISMINEPIDKELNVLEIGCDCGATLLAIQALLSKLNTIWYRN